LLIKLELGLALGIGLHS